MRLPIDFKDVFMLEILFLISIPYLNCCLQKILNKTSTILSLSLPVTRLVICKHFFPTSIDRKCLSDEGESGNKTDIKDTSSV